MLVPLVTLVSPRRNALNAKADGSARDHVPRCSLQPLVQPSLWT